MTQASPCVGTCRLDPATGWCLGCARTGDEIAGWGGQTDAARAAVWEALPERFGQLGVSCRRLPWATADIQSFVARTLREAAGTWVVGVVGAVAEFAAQPGAAVALRIDGPVAAAVTKGGALRFEIDEDVRALTFDTPNTPTQREPIVLAVKRARGRPALAAMLTDLGPDPAPIRAGADGARVFDLGLGRKEARFCVRCAPGAAQDALAAACGLSLGAALPRIAPPLLRESPVRIVQTALGRIEVSTAIPPPGGRSPAGPHTHLLPDHLATGRALPAGMDLPRAYLPGAIFYPPG
ncbi:MAG: DUF1289 domain-containing protein [Pseudomonadota bacterium]